MSAYFLAKVLKNVIIVALLTGFRMGELIGLKWEDVDLDDRILYVTQQAQRVQRRNNGTILKFVDLKTAKSKRPIPVGENCLIILHSHQRLLLAEQKLAGPRWKEDGLVFPSSIGTLLEQTTLWRTFKRLLVEAGIDPTVHFHDMRHTNISATRSSKVGADVATAMKRSGHTQTKTLDRYTHQIANENDFKIADNLDEEGDV